LVLSGSVWLAGGYAFCGTDTTVVPWLLIVATPLTLLLLVGHVGITRKSWRLFALSVLGAPLLLVIGLFSLTAIFGMQGKLADGRRQALCRGSSLPSPTMRA
jgi:hypothetical protein